MRIIIKKVPSGVCEVQRRATTLHAGVPPLISPSIFNFLPHLFLLHLWEGKVSSSSSRKALLLLLCYISKMFLLFASLCGQREGGTSTHPGGGPSSPLPEIYIKILLHEPPGHFFSFRLLWTPLFLTPPIFKKGKKIYRRLVRRRPDDRAAAASPFSSRRCIYNNFFLFSLCCLLKTASLKLLKIFKVLLDVLLLQPDN